MSNPKLDKIPFFPLIKNFKENTIFKAFILTAIYNTVLLSLTLGSKDYMNKLKMNPYLNLLISLFNIFIITLVSYTIMYLIFGFGESMRI